MFLWAIRLYPIYQIYQMLYIILTLDVLLVHQIVSYLLDLPEKDEEEVERAQINNFDTLWGETGGNTFFRQTNKTQTDDRERLMARIVA